MQRPAVCDFLHGPMTSPHAVAALRDALAAGAEKHFEILYYRKDGECSVFINYPLRSLSICRVADSREHDRSHCAQRNMYDDIDII